jgi:hypothetical protein
VTSRFNLYPKRETVLPETALVLAASALSTRWSLGYVGSPVCLDVIAGGVTVDRCRAVDRAMCSPSMHGYWRVVTLPQFEPPVWRPTYGIRNHYSRRVWAFILPLWIPFALLAIPTTILWLRDRHCFPSGHCQHCGYDLTGNVSGRCPECGTPIEREGKPA